MLKLTPMTKVNIIRKAYVIEDQDGNQIDKKYLKMFWLECKSQNFKQQYNTDSAPRWVMEYYNKLIK